MKHRRPGVTVSQDNTSISMVVTIKDGSSVLDLSSATGDKLFHAKDEAGVAVTTSGVATFVTDGTDGKMQFPLTANEVDTVRLLYCEFELQGFQGGNMVTETFLIDVVKRAKVS